MSLSGLRTVRVVDPLLNFGSERVFGVFDGGQDYTYNRFVATSFSDSNCQITCNPADATSVLNPKIYAKISYSITVTGDVQPGNYLLNIGTGGCTDAPRAYPNTQIMNTIEVQLNGSSITTNCNQYFNAMTRCSMLHDNEERAYSIAPTMLDQFQSYADGMGSIRNPLNGYESNDYQCPRGGFVLDSVTGNTINNTLGVVSKTAVVTFTSTEQIFISPFNTSKCGITWINTMVCNFTFGDLRRIWSHDNTSGTVLADNAWTVHITGITLLFQSIKPKFYERIPRVIPYAYNEVQMIVTQLGTITNSGVSTSVSLQSINLSAVPRRLMMVVARNTADQGITTSDTYARIDSITLNWATNQGKLASATIQDLYEISVRNGCMMSFTQWTTEIGSVLLIDMGKDIGLEEGLAPSVLANPQISGTINFTNISSENINFSLFCFVIYEGTLVLSTSQMQKQIASLTPGEVRNAMGSATVEVGHTPTNAYGGSFWGDVWNGVKSAASNVWNEGARPAISRLFDRMGRGSGLEEKKTTNMEDEEQALNNYYDEYQVQPRVTELRSVKRRRTVTGGRYLSRKELEDNISDTTM